MGKKSDLKVIPYRNRMGQLGDVTFGSAGNDRIWAEAYIQRLSIYPKLAQNCIDIIMSSSGGTAENGIVFTVTSGLDQVVSNALIKSQTTHASKYGIDFSRSTFSTAAIKTTGDIVLDDGDLIISALSTPANASAAGATGTIAWDASYIYVKASATVPGWKRAAISTW